MGTLLYRLFAIMCVDCGRCIDDEICPSFGVNECLLFTFVRVHCDCFAMQKQQRELTVRHARETERDMKKRLDVQKNEYEDTIKRHLSFIDQVSAHELQRDLDSLSITLYSLHTVN